MDNGYKVNYGEFREALKEAVQNCSENWTGVHGLRYSYAQESGASRAELSLVMGHSRIEVLDVYLYKV